MVIMVILIVDPDHLIMMTLEWYDWSDIEIDEGYCDPFREEVGGESVITSCKSGMTVDDAVIAAVREHGDTLCLSDYSGNIDLGPGECFPRSGSKLDTTPEGRIRGFHAEGPAGAEELAGA